MGWPCDGEDWRTARGVRRGQGLSRRPRRRQGPGLREALEVRVGWRGVAERYRTLREFWPFYLREHSRRGTRALHLSGTALASLFLLASAALRQPWFLLGALLCGYAFAWVGHYFVEHNRPATFTYPLKSFLSDWKMFGYFLAGRLGRELDALGLRDKT